MRTTNWCHIIPGLYAPNGTMQYAGGAYSWLKNTVAKMECYDAKVNGTSPYNYMNEQIAQSPIGSNGLIFLPTCLASVLPAGIRTPRAPGSV